MDRRAFRTTTVSASVDDAYDGVLRLLGDAQRFGLGLEALRVEQGRDGCSNITATFAVPAEMDSEVLVARLSRHPALRNVMSQDERLLAAVSA